MEKQSVVLGTNAALVLAYVPFGGVTGYTNLING